MRVGICGYPGSGKTTVFTALAPGASSNKGGVTYGNIKVPDERVDRLAALFDPKKTVYAEITFVDVGGTGGGAGGAFPPAVVQHMRNADVVVHVVRVFDNPMLGDAPNPQSHVANFDAELVLLDLGILEKRGERMAKENAKGAEVDVNGLCVAHLEEGEPLRTLSLTDEQRSTLTGIQLLSFTPLITLYNLSEEAWDDPTHAQMREMHETGSGVSLGVCGSIEQEISELEPEEQADFLEALGLTEPARNPFIRAAYAALDYVSFLTAGPDECRAWPVRRDSTARKAAGRVHSDIERGFIRAEVYRLEDLEAVGTEAELKKIGKIRVEGKDYVVQDGDVMHYRFNV